VAQIGVVNETAAWRRPRCSGDGANARGCDACVT